AACTSACWSPGSSRWWATPSTASAARPTGWRSRCSSWPSSTSSAGPRATRSRWSGRSARGRSAPTAPSSREPPTVRAAPATSRRRTRATTRRRRPRSRATPRWCQGCPVRTDDEGTEPDYRFTLANERTFLAWMRTALALLAGGIALEEVAGAFSTEGTRTALAVTAVLFSLVLAASAFHRWRQVQRAMRLDEPLPHPWAVPLPATGLVAAAGRAAPALAF